MRGFLSCLLAALALGVFCGASAQTEDPPKGWRRVKEAPRTGGTGGWKTLEPAEETGAPRIRVDVDLVNVTFQVRDRNGGLVSHLAAEDFELFEDGNRQEIRHFSRDQDSPLTVGIIIDRSRSQAGFEEENVAVATAFLRRIIRPQDSAFVVAFARRIYGICPPGNDLERLEGGLRELDHRFGEGPVLGPRVRRWGGSAVRDSIYWSAKEWMDGVTGRKALVMIGDGYDNASRVSLSTTVELLQSRDVVFYGLNNRKSRKSMHYGESMDKIATQSGGEEIFLSRVSLDEALRAIEQQLRTMYSLGYVSSNSAKDGQFRKIEIRPKNKNLRVRARTGYYASGG